MRWPPSTGGYSAAPRGRRYRGRLAATEASEPPDLLRAGADTSRQSRAVGLPRGDRPGHGHIPTEVANTDTATRVVGYVVFPEAHLTAADERQQKRSNTIVSRAHSAIV